ncbi:MAG: GNAT family N-acetyltransferase [Candidatus Kapaibacterium sp.]
MSISFEYIKETSPYLSEVITLSNRNKQLLGFFPEGAFRDKARSGNVLVAIDETGTVVGYILFRIARLHAAIVQLCVHENQRKNGVATALVTRFQEDVDVPCGIKVTCRTDFDANEFWVKVGFILMGRKKGRAKQGSELNVYWYETGRLGSLFAPEEEDESRPIAAVDANVYYNIAKTKDEQGLFEHPLMADWLVSEIQLLATQELKNETGRHKDKHHVNRTVQEIEVFGVLPPVTGRSLVELTREIGTILSPRKIQDYSDCRELAHAIYGGASFFVTRDTKILKARDRFRSAYAIEILKPEELITHFDTLIRGASYQQNRLSGSGVKIQRIGGHLIDGLKQSFLRADCKESRSNFISKLNTAVSHPDIYEGFVATDENQADLAMFVIDQSSPQTHRFPIIRSRKHNRLAGTALRTMIFERLATSRRGQLQTFVVNDSFVSPDSLQILADCGFRLIEGRWTGTALRDLSTVSDALKKVRKFAELDKTLWSQRLLETIERLALSVSGAKGIQSLELLLWPFKADSPEINTFIVPIKPVWAEALFDVGLANAGLFPVDPMLALGMENVYFRSSKQNIFEIPARILWYVSQDKRIPGTGAIRAMSYLGEIHVGSAKSVFSKFESKGIYSWQDIMGITKNNPMGHVMAFTFHHTETFANPVSFMKVQTILHDLTGKKNQLQGPVRIAQDVFKALYLFGQFNDGNK